MGFISDLTEDIDELAGSACPMGKYHTKHCSLCWQNSVAGLLQDIHQDLMQDADASDLDLFTFNSPSPFPSSGVAMLSQPFVVDQRVKTFVLGIDTSSTIKVEIVGPHIVGSIGGGAGKVIYNQYTFNNIVLPCNQLLPRNSQLRFTVTYGGVTPTIFGFTADVRRIPSSDRNLFRIERP